LALAIAALLVATGVHAVEPVAVEGSAADYGANLLSLTPPVAGYSSANGVMYDALPLLYERAMFGRVGLRLAPTMIVYWGAVQEYGLVVALPVYSSPRRADRPYGGAYAAPLLAGAVDRLPRTRRAVLGGAEGGYAWSFSEQWRFSVGLWYLLGSSGIDGPAGGITLALGRWL
jgi:hypothetical protein